MSYNQEIQSNNTDLQSILDTINALPEEKTLTDLLPTLSNPATAEDVAEGKQFVDGTGAVISGTLEPGFDEYMHAITSSGTFTVPATGKYRVTAIGAGSAAKYRDSSTTWYSGCCGGGGYIELDMVAGSTYTATINGYAQLANSAGTVLINATAASGPTNSAAGTSGTVSGSGVTAFSSNGKSSQKDIIPPDFYNNSRYVSRGGYGGWSLSDIEEHSTDSSHSQSQDRNGGAGLFGGSGSDGGDAGHGYVVAQGYSTGAFYTNPVRDPEAGGGKGGRGIAEYDGSAGGASPYNLPGGGGGGGYGGGGGVSGTRTYTYYTTRYIYGNGGGGGAACIFIHRIG